MNYFLFVPRWQLDAVNDVIDLLYNREWSIPVAICLLSILCSKYMIRLNNIEKQIQEYSCCLQINQIRQVTVCTEEVTADEILIEKYVTINECSYRIGILLRIIMINQSSGLHFESWVVWENSWSFQWTIN